VYFGWAKLSHCPTATSIGQNTILIAHAPNLSIGFRAHQNPSIAAQFAAQTLATAVKSPGAVSSVVERLV
jgi:hypothetical protein